VLNPRMLICQIWWHILGFPSSSFLPFPSIFYLGNRFASHWNSIAFSAAVPPHRSRNNGPSPSIPANGLVGRTDPCSFGPHTEKRMCRLLLLLLLIAGVGCRHPLGTNGRRQLPRRH
jgi:hypothetical protein